MIAGVIYYECHITVEPVEGERLNKFKEISQKWNFKVANLLMQKTKDPSKLDSFCTGKDKIYFYMENRMNKMLEDLKKENFNIFRYKIEAILVDSKCKT